MEIIKQNTNINYIEFQGLYKNVDFLNTIFFDIETTGFLAKNSHLYLIGVLYVSKETNTFTTIQWFSNKKNDEREIILAFAEFMKNYTTLIHFNGKGFDIPYLEAKAENLGVNIEFDNLKHIDLYKSATKLKKFFNTENIKLKTLEQFFNLNRDDTFSGKDLISVYEEYIHKNDNILKEFLLLHNYEDLKGMLTVLNILAYEYIFNEQYNYVNIEHNQTNHEIVLELALLTPVNTRISYSTDNIYLTVFNTKLKLLVKSYEGELKYFYENYKDYYYLPQEDMAIHKTLATYVDKEFKEKAKKTNCYTKKVATFLPQYTTLFNPSFKENYKDNISYFELNDEFINNEVMLVNYAKHIINYLKDIR